MTLHRSFVASRAQSHWAVGLALALMLSVSAVSAQESSECLACHADEEPRVDAVELSRSIHSELACADCHTAAADLPHSPDMPPVVCADCHDGPAEALAESIHGHLEGSRDEDAPTCTSCHGTHDIRSPADLESTVARLKVDFTCLGCHGQPEIADTHNRLPSSEFANRYLESVHGKGVHLKGLVVSATCIDCHEHHAILPTANPDSSTNRKNIPRTCAQCHQGIYDDFEESAHGQNWAEGRRNGPVCTDCHESHEIKEPTKGPFRTGIVRECGGCHEEEAATFGDTFHGQATSLGFVVAAKCSDCHTAHRNLAASDPKSTVNPANLQKTCGTCHPGANENFIEYQPHLDAHDPEDSTLVYWIATFMKWLLFSVFVGWGLHTLLWFQRAVVSIVRKEYVEEETEQYVRRFPRNVVTTHVVIVTSFLALVATGIPLLYHHTAWAKILGTLVGGVEVARYFHRVFAVATFGYGFYHLIWLVLAARRSAGWELFYGPDSLVPRPKDLVDLRDNLRWFFYLGPPPKYGRWTYFEKFDYFAVFWGIPVIGFSGLLLWFPTLFASFLPGIAFNIATIVHSEEALLAAGFIFTFHFFHNHLRPENFPLDTVVFTGRVPLTRFKQERPEEYQLRVERGTLDEILVSPPDKALVWRARVFGFASLFVGLLLVAAVFGTYLLG